MKINKYLAGAVVALLAIAVLIGAAFAAGYGSSEDPLITKSYLDSVFTPDILGQMRAELKDSESALRAEIEEKAGEIEDMIEASQGLMTDDSSFSVVRLDQGQVLKGSVGTELMLRIGSAVCYAESSTGIIDTTTSATLENGNSMQTNHMYMVTIEGRGMKATSYVMVLVRGSYTIS